MTGTDVDCDVTLSTDDHKPNRADGPCPAWCDRDHPGWQDHMGVGWMCFVVLSTEDPVVDGERADGRPDYRPKELEIYLQQHVRKSAPVW